MASLLCFTCELDKISMAFGLKIGSLALQCLSVTFPSIYGILLVGGLAKMVYWPNLHRPPVAGWPLNALFFGGKLGRFLSAVFLIKKAKAFYHRPDREREFILSN